MIWQKILLDSSMDTFLIILADCACDNQQNELPKQWSLWSEKTIN